MKNIQTIDQIKIGDQNYKVILFLPTSEVLCACLAIDIIENSVQKLELEGKTWGLAKQLDLFGFAPVIELILQKRVFIA